MRLKFKVDSSYFDSNLKEAITLMKYNKMMFRNGILNNHIMNEMGLCSMPV